MTTLTATPDAALHDLHLRASRAAGRLAASLAARGVHVRVVLHRDGLGLFIPDAVVQDANHSAPIWAALRGLPVQIASPQGDA